jgi:hypothetical protein
MGIYATVLMPLGYTPDFAWQPNPAIRTNGGFTYLAVNLGGVIFYTDNAALKTDLLALVGVGAFANRAALIAMLTRGISTVSEFGRIARLAPLAASGNNARGLSAVMGAIITAITFGAPL